MKNLLPLLAFGLLTACATQPLPQLQQPKQLTQILQNLKQLQLPITPEKLEVALGLALPDPTTATRKQALIGNAQFGSYTMPLRSQIDAQGMRGFSLKVNSNALCFDKQQMIVALGQPTRNNGVTRHQDGNLQFESAHSFTYGNLGSKTGQLFPSLVLSFEGTPCLLEVYLKVEESRGVL